MYLRMALICIGIPLSLVSAFSVSRVFCLSVYLLCVLIVARAISLIFYISLYM